MSLSASSTNQLFVEVHPFVLYVYKLNDDTIKTTTNLL